MLPELVPQFILDHYARGHTSGGFQAASLFVDLSGFSAVTSALMQHGNQAAEAMANTMAAIFTPLVDIIHQQGGIITTFAGDAFTALFPVLGEQQTDLAGAAQQGLAAASRIQVYMAAHAGLETGYGRFSFSVKLGLAAGEVEWGILHPEESRDAVEHEVKATYYFGGLAVDAAAQAEHQASSGTIILSPSIQPLLAPWVKTLPVGTTGYQRFLIALGELPTPRTLVAAPLPSSEAQRPFIPDAILQRTSRGEFRQVITVFVNLLGIDSPADLALFMPSVFALQRQYGGYLHPVDFGDKGCNLLLFWGMPTNHEHDLERALSFILDLSATTPVTFRAGITYRPMYAGFGGSPHRGAFTGYGQGINLAARLMVNAPWGAVWLEEAVARRARRHFVVEPQGRFAFKGFPDGQPVYALLERASHDDEAVAKAPLVGRRRELAHLTDFIQPLLTTGATQRCAGLLVVIGEAGLGKSRLLHEFVHAPQGPVVEQCQVHLAQTDQILRQPLNPFRYWLRHYFEQVSTQSESRNKRAFSHKLDLLITATSAPDLQRELNRLRSFLGALVGLHWENSLYTQLEPQSRYENTLIAIKTLLRAESLRRPLLLILEDLHWLDEASCELLPHLLRNMDAYPLAILATARPEREELLGSLPHLTLPLEAMAHDELVTLAERVLEAPPGPKLQTLLGRAEGNPFFAEQILFYLRETGAIQVHESIWEPTNRGQPVALPDDLRVIFTARLDQLAQEVKEVVQTAATLGREFEVAVLAWMLRDEETLPQCLSQAEQATIWSALNQWRYLFKHVLLRDAAYEMQLLARRRELHWMAAQALETLHSADLAPRYGEIAYHYETACQQGLAQARQPACAYLQLAGQQAAERFENSAGVDYFSRALALLSADDEETHFQLLLARESLLHLQGARQAQAEDLSLLSQLAACRQRPGEQAEVALRQARYAHAIDNYPATYVAAQQAVTLAQAAQDLRIEGAAHLEWGMALVGQSAHSEADDHYEQTLLLARAAGDLILEAGALRALGAPSHRRGDLAHARNFLSQALTLARTAGSRLLESNALHSLGWVARGLGEYDMAQVYAEQALALRRGIGDRLGESRSLELLGTITSERGAYTTSATTCEQSLIMMREVGDRRGEGEALGHLGEVARHLGDYDKAHSYYWKSLHLIREIGLRSVEAVILSNLGTIAEVQGDYASACASSKQSLTLAQAIGEPLYQGYALTCLGDALVGLGRLGEAAASLAEALALRQRVGHTALVLETRASLARLALAQGDLPQAATQVTPILAHLEAGQQLYGAEAPLRIMLTCYRVLQANADPHASDLLRRAYEQLQTQASQLDDEARQRYLTNIPWNREVLAAWQALNGIQTNRTLPDSQLALTVQAPPALGLDPPPKVNQTLAPALDAQATQSALAESSLCPDQLRPVQQPLVAAFPTAEALAGDAESMRVQRTVADHVVLRETLVQYFSLIELRTLAFDLGIEFEDLGGASRPEKVLALLRYVAQHQLVVQLLEAAQRQRPEISWPPHLKPHDPGTK
jgi:predicted ATPase/class 3 adenylate cyclase